MLLLILSTLYAIQSYPTILIHGIASSREQLEPFASKLDHNIYNIEIGIGIFFIL